MSYNPDTEAMLLQFNRLMSELLKGAFARNTFRPWEIELLLDIEQCELDRRNKREILKRYQKAQRRHVERGADALLKLSEYLERNRVRRESRSLPVDDEARN
jgi:CRP-like cAMP-binding protein